MMKKIFGMAAVSALAFGMFACSDGADGVNGTDGKDGKDGTSCAVKAIKGSSGFKVLCDGDSVGVLLNATDGEDGEDGANGKDGKNGADGKDSKDGKAVTGKNGSDGDDGTGCSAKENKAKNGYDIVCDGKTVGTVTNGADGKATDGDDGKGCSLKEGKDGAVTITCDGKSATLFKNACGKLSYDPLTHFCYDGSKGTIAKRCKYRVGFDGDQSNAVYDPAAQFCDEKDTLRTLCTVKKDDGSTEKVSFNFEKEYCDTDSLKVTAYIPCAPGSDVKRKTSQYCYTTKDAEGIQLGTLATCGSGNGARLYNPRLKACLSKSSGSNIASKQGDRLICGDAAAQKDTLNIDIRYNKDINDDGRGQLCDDRDWKIYKTTKIDNQVWMAQNLNYAYNLPSYGFGTAENVGVEFSSACMPDDPDCETYGRYYLWSAAIDSTKLASLPPEEGGRICGRGNYCEFDDDVKGVCPTGWHLPSKAEVQTLFDFVGTSNGTDLLASGSDKYGFSGLNHVNNCMAEQTVDGKQVIAQSTTYEYPIMWTSTGVSKSSGNYYNALIRPTLEFGAGILTLAVPVRCIKD